MTFFADFCCLAGDLWYVFVGMAGVSLASREGNEVEVNNS